MPLFKVALRAIEEGHASTPTTCSLHLVPLKFGIKDLAPHHYFSDFGRVKLILEANFRAKIGLLMGKRERSSLVFRKWEVREV